MKHSKTLYINDRKLQWSYYVRCGGNRIGTFEDFCRQTIEMRNELNRKRNAKN